MASKRWHGSGALGRATALLCSTALAGCVTGGSGPVARLDAGGFQMIVDTPTDWQPVDESRAPRGGHIFVCKPLACRHPAILNVETAPHPTRAADRATLQRILDEEIRKAVAVSNAAAAPLDDGTTHSEIVRAEIGTVNGFPAISMELRQIQDDKPKHQFTDVMFVGPLEVMLKAASPDREQARKGIELIRQQVHFRNVPTS